MNKYTINQYVINMIFRCDYCEKILLRVGFSAVNIEGLFEAISERKSDHKIEHCDGCRAKIRIEYHLDQKEEDPRAAAFVNHVNEVLDASSEETTARLKAFGKSCEDAGIKGINEKTYGQLKKELRVLEKENEK